MATALFVAPRAQLTRIVLDETRSDLSTTLLGLAVAVPPILIPQGAREYVGLLVIWG
jgi:hypothetical protein